MNPRRLLALMTLPVLVGTFGLVALNQATAQSTNRLAQNSSQPNPQQEGRRNHRGPDFAAAAQKLGISEATLKEALGVPANPTPGQRPPRPDFKAAAAKLGITEEQLVNALGIPPPSPTSRFHSRRAETRRVRSRFEDRIGSAAESTEYTTCTGTTPTQTRL